MRVFVTNESSVLTDAQVLDALPALRRQTAHVREWWRSSLEDLVFAPAPTEEAWQIRILDNSDQQGALAYHDLTPGGRPISYVFAKTELDYGYSWTVSFSHELVEMIVDPWCSAAIQTGGSEFYALEVADPVEADALGYEIRVAGHAPVLVSDFVTPMWYQPGSVGPLYSHKGHASAPLAIEPGGYAYVWEPGGWNMLDEHGQRTPEAEVPADRRRLKQYARERSS